MDFLFKADHLKMVHEGVVLKLNVCILSCICFLSFVLFEPVVYIGAVFIYNKNILT